MYVLFDWQAEPTSPVYCEFAVSHLLQTHSLNNDPNDRKTQVWGCEFEPDPERKGRLKHLVCNLALGCGLLLVSCL